MSISLQAVFAADAHLPEEQILREEPTVSKGKSQKFRPGTSQAGLWTLVMLILFIVGTERKLMSSAL
jgi:hypothetical protein